MTFTEMNRIRHAIIRKLASTDTNGIIAFCNNQHDAHGLWLFLNPTFEPDYLSNSFINISDGYTWKKYGCFTDEWGAGYRLNVMTNIINNDLLISWILRSSGPDSKMHTEDDLLSHESHLIKGGL
jgi:hypothetical protein